MNDDRNRIVAMVSKGYVDGEPCVGGANLAEIFEDICYVNQLRGFDLESWQMTASTATNHRHSICANDTIVAVFRRREPA